MKTIFVDFQNTPNYIYFLSLIVQSDGGCIEI